MQFELAKQSDGKTKYYEEWPCRCAAMAVYYAQKRYKEKEGSYANDIESLKLYSASPFELCDDADVTIKLTANGYEASATLASYTATVNEERYLVVSSDGCATAQA